MPTTQIQPQNPSNQINVSGVAHSVTFVRSGGPVQEVVGEPVLPAPVHRRFDWFRSLMNDTVAIPALYGLLAPPLCSLVNADFADRLWLYTVLPYSLAFCLGFFRSKKRLGGLMGGIFGLTSGMTMLVDAMVHHGAPPELYSLIYLIYWGGTLIFWGAVIGAAATSTRQGAAWLFGSNRP